MQTYTLNDANLAISQAYRPQLERFFNASTIYVVEQSSDYASLPAGVQTLLGGRTSTTFLKSASYYRMLYKALKAQVFLHPDTDMTTFSFEANGTTALGTSATVGNANHCYSQNGVYVSKISPTDTKSSNSYRAETFFAKHITDKYKYNIPYNIGFGFKIVSWDETATPTARLVIMQIHQTEDAGDYSGTPVLNVALQEGTVRIDHSGYSGPITPGVIPDKTLYSFPIVLNTWFYLTFRIVFNATRGSLIAYLNGEIVGGYYNEVGFNDVKGPYTKMGCYEGSSHGFQDGSVSREIHYKGLIVIEERAGYSLNDIYQDLKAV